MKIDNLICALFISVMLYSVHAYGQQQDFKNSITFLSSTETQGRYPGSEGDSIVRHWLAGMFQKAGLKPVADGYSQPFNLVEYTRFDSSLELLKDLDRQFVYGKDFSVRKSAEGTATAQYIYVGHGINDSLHFLMKDKVVILNQTRSDITSIPYYRKITLQQILSAGAVAVLSVMPDGYDFGNTRVKGESRSSYDLLVLNIDSCLLPYFIPSRLIDEYSPEDIYNSPYISDTGDVVKISVEKEQNVIHTGNVTGLKAGESEDYIVIGAHHDHLGLNSLTGEIYHGANDNASGVAMLLELASQLATAHTKLNIVFVAFGGEEKGLLGSRYFTEHSPVPLNKIRLMINLDIIGNMTADTLCYYKSNVDLPLPGINGSGLNLKREDAGISDHISFMMAKIPTVFFHTGYDAERIHTPHDREQNINYDGMVKTLYFLKDLILAIDDGMKDTTRPAVKVSGKP